MCQLGFDLELVGNFTSTVIPLRSGKSRTLRNLAMPFIVMLLPERRISRNTGTTHWSAIFACFIGMPFALATCLVSCSLITFCRALGRVNWGWHLPRAIHSGCLQRLRTRVENILCLDLLWKGCDENNASLQKCDQRFSSKWKTGYRHTVRHSTVYKQYPSSLAVVPCYDATTETMSTEAISFR